MIHVIEFEGTGRFEVLARLGRGGTGAVYEVLDHERNVHVALKQLELATADALLRFKSEFRALQAIQHRNLVLPGELIEDGGNWFFTMELVHGVDFLVYVRPGTSRQVANSGDRDGAAFPDGPARAPTTLCGAGFDEARLRSALAQLSLGICALHSAGKIHRDIKPSNICVSDDGRLTLLDLGLVADLDQDSLQGNSIAGTAYYMAPEQAASGHVGPEADWYAVGVLMYQALTGRLPFEGNAFQVLLAKQDSEPRPPNELALGVPADLNALCVDLLRLSPDDRPNDSEVLARLRADTRTVTVTSNVSVPFVGRRDDLRLLHDQFSEVRERGGATVIIEGESGVGKTALVKRFVEQLGFGHRAAGEDPPLVLAGKCYESESVPYKALDGIMDALSRWLTRASSQVTAELIPENIAALAQVFPVLRRAEVIATAPRPTTEPVDERERRALVFTVLRELLAGLAESRPFVLVIDDLQWAGADSIAMLRDMMREPAPPKVLLIGIMRPGPPLDLPGRVRHVELDRLSLDEARSLARALLDQEHMPPAERAPVDDRDIANEAAGHPLFISELVRYARTHPGRALSEVHLEGALWSRILALDPAVRRLLEVTVVAGVPLEQQVAARAAEASDFNEYNKWVATLRLTHLVRTTGVRTTDVIEPYHDRVRAAVLVHIADEVRSICHRRIAVSLEQTLVADPELLAVHWEGAGDTDRAAEHALEAAEQASEAFAFDRAARLYERAIELRNPTGADLLALQMKLGEAMANAGRGVEAAHTYMTASMSAPASTSLELRRMAAEELLRGGYLTDGLATLRGVLDEIGLKLAKTPRRAMLSLLLTRARVRVRGLRFREREERDIPGEKLTAVDTCGAIGIGLSMVDHMRGAEFQARHLLLALDAGEPSRIARSMAIEAAYCGTPGGEQKRAHRLLAIARELSRRIDDPATTGSFLLSEAITHYLAGKFAKARRICDRAEVILRDHCAGMTWELFNARYYKMLCFAWMGEISRFNELVPALRLDADQRSDLFAWSLLHNGLTPLYEICRDDPDRALQGSHEVVAQLEGGLEMHRLWEMLTVANASLYKGDGATALAIIDERFAQAKRAMLFRVQYLRVEATWLRARALLSTAQRAEPSARKGLLGRAASDAKHIEKQHMPWSNGMAMAVRAGIARVEGDLPAAVDGYMRAEQAFTAGDEKGFAASARHRAGALLGGDEGAALVASADAYLTGEDVAVPARYVRMWLGTGDPA